jgi:SnoaL-like domain
MLRGRRPVLVLSLITAAPSLSHAQKATPTVGALADTLRGLAVGMAERLRARDAEGTLILYGDTLHFVHVENGTVIPWARMAPMVRSYLASAAENPVFLVGTPGVTIADRDNAVVYATHRIDSTAGHPGHSGVWTGVLHRFPEGWRIVHSHSSDSRAGP